MIVVVAIPVLGRPGSAQAVIDTLERSDPHSVCRPVFVCSPGDGRQIAACRLTGADVAVLDSDPGPGDFARKINYAHSVTHEPFLFQAADDVEFTEGWVENALAWIDRAGGYGVCGTQDRANPAVKRGLHSTHSLIRRRYVDECGGSWDGPGTVFSEAYSHQWVDTELVELAKARGCFVFCPAAVVVHHHPFYERGVRVDDTYRRGLADAHRDRQLFRRRQQQWQRELTAA